MVFVYQNRREELHGSARAERPRAAAEAGWCASSARAEGSRWWRPGCPAPAPRPPTRPRPPPRTTSTGSSWTTHTRYYIQTHYFFNYHYLHFIQNPLDTCPFKRDKLKNYQTNFHTVITADSDIQRGRFRCLINYDFV